MKKYLKALFLTAVLVASTPADATHEKNSMVENLEFLKHTLEDNYAPLEWKKSQVHLDLQKTFEFYKNEILTKNVTLKEFHQMARAFVNSTRDYHVKVMFYSTEEASLPFTVKAVGDRYFISWVDDKKLPAEIYGITVGDELLTFDNRPTHQVVTELMETSGPTANYKTDQSLVAEGSLTSRKGMLGDVVPRGPVNITVKSALDGSKSSYQLIWDYEPEQIAAPPAKNISRFAAARQPVKTKPVKELLKGEMVSPVAQAYMKEDPIPGSIGGKYSYLPLLGGPEWFDDHNVFVAYIYENDNGHKIGYIRIPGYHSTGEGKAIEAEDLQHFGETINYLQANTDALVLDQLHNPGGYLHYVHILTSMLTDRPLTTPKHRIAINQQSVWEATNILKEIEKEMEKEKYGDEYRYIDSLSAHQQLLFIREYFRFIVSEWNAGRTVTAPTHLHGCDYVLPHPKYRYTKPILMLVDEMDFSGGDFAPAILQDNNRAVIFGTRTAGAGGFVGSATFLNQTGIAMLRYTGSLAERADTMPIEDLGVTPDIPYELTVDDVQYGYQGMVDSINAAVEQLIE